MSIFNLCNQFDQKSDGVVHYIGREFKEFEDLVQEEIEEIAQDFSELYEEIEAGIPLFLVGMSAGWLEDQGIHKPHAECWDSLWYIGGRLTGHIIAGVQAASEFYGGVFGAIAGLCGTSKELLSGGVAARNLSASTVAVGATAVAHARLVSGNAGENMLKDSMFFMKRLSGGRGSNQIRFKCKDGLDEKEFNRQLKLQQDGLNELTVEEYLQNRKRYKEQGRAPEGNAAQENARIRAKNEKIDELRRSGLNDVEAEKKASEWLEGQTALHSPDQVAGGYPDRVTGVGDSRVNSSLGAQWKSRVNDLDSYVEKLAENMTEQERRSTYLDIELIR